MSGGMWGALASAEARAPADIPERVFAARGCRLTVSRHARGWSVAGGGEVGVSMGLAEAVSIAFGHRSTTAADHQTALYIAEMLAG